MSIDAGFDFKVLGFECSIQILEVLFKFGWSFDDYGQKTYLPVGDNGDFEWCSSYMSVQNLMDILRKKNELGELIGVVLTWGDTNIGGEFLVNLDGAILFSLSMNRKCIGENQITDVSWYLEKILPAFYGFDIKIESFKYQEYF